MKATKLLSTALATGALTAAVLSPAGAAILYDDINYGKELGRWKVNVSYVGDSINDRTSSIKMNGRPTQIFSDLNFKGYSVRLDADYNNLRTLTEGMGGNGNWNDRISSFMKV